MSLIAARVCWEQRGHELRLASAGNGVTPPGTVLPVTRALARLPWVPSLGALLRPGPSGPKLPGGVTPFPTAADISIATSRSKEGPLLRDAANVTSAAVA